MASPRRMTAGEPAEGDAPTTSTSASAVFVAGASASGATPTCADADADEGADEGAVGAEVLDAGALAAATMSGSAAVSAFAWLGAACAWFGACSGTVLPSAAHHGRAAHCWPAHR
ncbi:hypothetical protein FrCorBMG51_04475 [Protofrankia coriariae]|uniref:Uncharacterized protein n=1 Tax=Protofrankia coriariae TaxID=1562887 RepID=A0ABR5F728_9ACTN|nr:hypothetical protein FrCorBMG51_04475 [Protofrankia coriariae]